MGIDVRKVVTFTFFLSGMCAAVAGVLVSGYYQMVYSTMGTEAGLKGFSAAVLGRHRRPVRLRGRRRDRRRGRGSGRAFLGGSFRSATAYIVLFLVLLIRPSGLFGKDNIDKV